MTERLIELIELLRQNGLAISVAESADALSAVAAVGLEDRSQVKATLMATLVKRASQRDVFERCFELFFRGSSRLLEAVDRSLAARIREEGFLTGDELTMVLLQLERLGGQLSPLSQALVSGDASAMARLMRGAALQLDFGKVQNALQTGFFARRLGAALGTEQTRRDWSNLAQELQRAGLRQEGVDFVARQLRAALEEVEAAARAEVQKEVQGRVVRQSGVERPIVQLSREEVEAARRSVRSLAERLKARLVQRQRSTRKGQLNARRTLRRNLSWGGVPMVPVFRRRRPLRPDVVVLCDVSDSVRTTSKLMLLWAHTLQDVFSRVRSFIFVSELAEVTALFKGEEPDVALEAVVGASGVSLSSNSNYGHALATFERLYLCSVSRRTTVIVIGDGRNNYNPANVWALEAVKRKAKQVVWICPEPRVNWGFGDSEMLKYEKAVNSVVTVQTLADFEKLSAKLGSFTSSRS